MGGWMVVSLSAAVKLAFAVALVGAIFLSACARAPRQSVPRASCAGWCFAR